MNQNSEMTRVLRRVAMFTGFATLLISIYFSYDGFDQSVSGENAGYSTLAIAIGLTLAVVVSVVQFIFGTSYAELNWTLRLAGIAAYVYSIYTNYLGIKHILGADDFMAISSALFMDIFPEPAIAWAVGDALTGDLAGNIGKIILGDNKKPTPQNYTREKSQYKPMYKPQYKPENKPAYSQSEFRPVNYDD